MKTILTIEHQVVLVFGGRDWTDETKLCRALLERGSGPLLVVTGGCKTGADAMARAWAHRRAAYGWPTRVRTIRARFASQGRSGGPRRNERIHQLYRCIDHTIACMTDGPGSAGMNTICEDLLVPVRHLGRMPGPPGYLPRVPFRGR